MPCQSSEAHTALVYTKTKVDPTLFGQFVGAETIISKKHADGWLYLLRSDNTQTYEVLEEKLKKLNAQVSENNIFHVIGPKGDFIVLGGSHSLLREIIDANGEFCTGVDVWRMRSTLPPRKRAQLPSKEPDRATTPSPPPASKEDPSQMLIPGFKRLSRQLQVDFSINVHGTEGKRRREPVRSIYEEAAIERANKKKRVRRQQAKKTLSTDTESSEIDEEEILKHAELLASLSGRDTPDPKSASKQSPPTYRSEAPSIIKTLARAMDIITQSNNDTMRAMEATTKALQDTVALQQSLITELLAKF